MCVPLLFASEEVTTCLGSRVIFTASEPGPFNLPPSSDDAPETEFVGETTTPGASVSNDRRERGNARAGRGVPQPGYAACSTRDTRVQGIRTAPARLIQ